MKTAAIATGAVLALFAGSALAGGPPANPGARGNQQAQNDAANGSKPYEIPPAWGINVCQDLKQAHEKNAFGQCISATARGLSQPGLTARQACSSLRPKPGHKSAHARRSARRAYKACTHAVRAARRQAAG